MELYAGTASQRDQVKAIREHLSLEEKRVLARHSVVVGATFALILLSFAPVAIASWVHGNPLILIATLVIEWVVLLLVLHQFQGAYRRLLCSTTWAQSQGISPEDLPITFSRPNRHS